MSEIVKPGVLDCIGSLLHTVHDDNLIDGKNALLQYCGLRMLKRAIQECDSWDQYNEACWSLRKRIELPAIRFVKIDPISSAPRPIPFTKSILVLPNNTTLTSGSTLVTQARERFPYRFDADAQDHAAIGNVARSYPEECDYYHEIWHLICREPHDPTLRSLSRGLSQLMPGEDVVLFRMPVFGKDCDWESWGSGLARWLFLRTNIQKAPTFMDLCYIPDSEWEADRIAAELRSLHIPHEWNSET